jgi:RES domain
LAKFPHSPGAAALANIMPSVRRLSAGTTLARVYFTRSPHALSWDAFRYTGPLNSRWDHHVSNAQGAGDALAVGGEVRGIYYAAADAKTCLAEVFQDTRRIDRAFQAPWLVVFKTLRVLEVLDLTGDFATRMGASMAIHSGSRGRARGWARDLYQAFPAAQGILYAASMHGGAPAFALNERALKGGPLFPLRPEFHRALADDAMLDPLKHAARALGYALR